LAASSRFAPVAFVVDVFAVDDLIGSDAHQPISAR